MTQGQKEYLKPVVEEVWERANSELETAEEGAGTEYGRPQQAN
jgi:hypothetical protein